MPRGDDTGIPTLIPPPLAPADGERRLGQTLAQAYPAAAKQWHPTRNLDSGLRPDTIDAHSSQVVWWCCSRGHETQAPVFRRTRYQLGCPRCSGRGYTVAELSATLAAEWDSRRNDGVEPDEVAAGSRAEVWWICPRGHQPYRMSPWYRTSHHKSCPDCRTDHAAPNKKQARSLPSRSLAEKYPVLADQFDVARNDREPGSVAADAGDRFHWRCVVGHRWQATIRERLRSACSRCKADPQPPLDRARPDLVAEWDFEANGPLLARHTVGSNERVMWICARNSDHRWSARINNRTGSRTGCPFCKGRRVETLAEQHPHVAAEWAEDYNGPLPDDLTVGSGRPAVWRCSRGHLWQSTVSHRVGMYERECQVCSSHRNIDSFRHFLRLYGAELVELPADQRRVRLELAGTLVGQGPIRTVAEAVLAGEVPVADVQAWVEFAPSESIDRLLAEHDPRTFDARRTIPEATRRLVYERDGHRCRNPYCSTPEARLSLDHDHAYLLGGDDEPENLITLCQSCNSRKSIRSYARFVQDEQLRVEAQTQAAQAPTPRAKRVRRSSANKKSPAAKRRA